MSTQLQAKTVTQIKGYLSNVDVKKRFEEMLGAKASQFMASIVNAVSSNKGLQACDPSSIMSSAFVAGSFDLPIDSNLGFSAIVPYGGKAQFQMMYKGFIQLAMRSGQYKSMNYAEVYEDELKSYNPITKRVSFNEKVDPNGQRNRGEVEKIVGYFSWFQLVNGFEQSLYMSVEEITNHAKKYSKSYQYDIRDGKKTSKWTTDFDVMAKKTVIKLILSKWGILSIDMQRAMDVDYKVYDADGNATYADNPKLIDTSVQNPFEEAGELTEEEKLSIQQAEKEGNL